MYRPIPSLFGALALALPLTACQAADQPARPTDAQAETALRKLADFYRAAPAIRTKATATLTVKGPGVDQQLEVVSKVAVQRPNLFAIDLSSGDVRIVVSSNGKQMLSYVSELQKYSVEEAPESLDGVLQSPLLGSPAVHATAQWLGALAAASPYDALLEDASEVKYVGEEEIAGVKCHRVRLVGEAEQTDLWIEGGDQPRLVQVQPDLAAQLRARGGTLPDGFEFALRVAFQDWQTDDQLAAASFAIEPPPGAEKVDSIFESSADGPHPLLGKEAPAFELALLAGGKVRLADHKDKEIVILDFWATWCGPCVRALPTIAEVAGEYKGKGVVFYAVNLAEEPAMVKEFLEQIELDIPVAMDLEGAVGTLYRADAIPQTVIVGKGGLVEAVHVGLVPDLKKQLSGELETLLGGKSLLKGGDKEPAKSEVRDGDQK